MMISPPGRSNAVGNHTVMDRWPTRASRIAYNRLWGTMQGAWLALLIPADQPGSRPAPVHQVMMPGKLAKYVGRPAT